MKQELQYNLKLSIVFKSTDLIEEIILNDDAMEIVRDKMKKIDFHKFKRFMNSHGNVIMDNPKGQFVISQWLH